MKCPVCKTECHDNTSCPECRFDNLSPVFLSKDEGEKWIEEVVWPYRRRYWKTLKHFRIENTTLVYGTAYTPKECVIPYGITSIHEEAFCECPLHEVSFPATLREIGQGAFCGCEELSTLKFEEGLQRIEGYAFSFCNLKTVKLPRSVSYIGPGVFETSSPLGKNDLKELVLPLGLEKLEEGALCNVHSIKIDSCNPHYFIKNDCLIEKASGTLIAVANKGITHVVVPSCVRRIANLAFEDCVKLKEVIICEGTKEIGGNVFYNTQNLKKIVLPQTLERIEECAFCGCFKLEKIVVPSSVSYIGWAGIEACKQVFCEAPYKSEGWDSSWLSGLCNATIYWGDEWYYNESGDPVLFE